MGFYETFEDNFNQVMLELCNQHVLVSMNKNLTFYIKSLAAVCLKVLQRSRLSVRLRKLIKPFLFNYIETL